MKHLTFSTIIFLTLFANAQSLKNGIPTDRRQNDNAVTYRLFPTQNMWTFIKLNTRNGQMWQVQWSMEENKRFVTNLNSVPLVDIGEEVNDRFTLYSTQNIFTFILLDQIDGKIRQVQWSMEANNRVIVPIE